MTNKTYVQDAQIVSEEEQDGNGTDALSNHIIDDDKETMIPISELRKVRSEAARYRKELQSLKSKIEEDKKKMELSSREEIDSLRSVASKAETELRSLKSKISIKAKESAVINAASLMGFCNPKDATSLIEFGQIDIDEEGNVDEEMVLDLVKELGESKPYLRKGQSKLNFGPTNPAPKSRNYPKPKGANSSQIEEMKYQARDLTRQGRILEATSLFNRAWEEEHGLKR